MCLLLMSIISTICEDPSKKRKFRVGDHVRVKYRGQEGYIIDINGPLYMVSLKDGAFVDSYTESQLERTIW
ncbi:MAG: KOW motif-containing protein [Lachnospiraceae bacterium]|nr:KOW motif-containing protein [Lachnospiraceae bacterium]